MISEKERKFAEALMLAITAPTDELAFECMGIAESIGSDLTDKQKDLAQMGIEVALETLRRVKK